MDGFCNAQMGKFLCLPHTASGVPDTAGRQPLPDLQMAIKGYMATCKFILMNSHHLFQALTLGGSGNFK